MSLLTANEWRVAEAIAGIGYVNPFLPERIELEKQALGKDFVRFQPFLQYRPDCSVSEMFPNAPALCERSGQLPEAMNSDCEQFGVDRLLRVICDGRAETLSASVARIETELAAWQGKERPQDDVSVLAVEISRK